MEAESSTKSKKLFLTGMILSMFCWGLSWTSGKVLSGYGGADVITIYRFAFTFVSLVVILALTNQNFRIAGKGIPDVLMASVLIGLYTYLFFKGLSVGKAGAGGVLVTTLNPLIMFGIVLLIKRRKPEQREIVGLLIGLIAGGILLKVWDNWDVVWSSGNSYFLLATLTWALLSLITARSSRYGSPVTFSLYMYGACTVLMLLIADYGKIVEVIAVADSYFWGNLFFSSTITTALATTFFFVATAKIGASQASSFIFLVPFSAALGSWVFLNEVPQLNTIVGGVLAIIAVFILNKK